MVITIPFPFQTSDGGRAASSHPKAKNDCTVRALALITGESYDQVWDLLASEAAGLVAGHGVHLDRWLVNRQDPVIGDPQDILGWRAERITFPARKWKPRMNPGTFFQHFHVGRYLVKTARHVYPVIDGVTYDLAPEREDRCIYAAWRFTRTDGGPK